MGKEYQARINWYKCAICKKRFTTYSATERWIYAKNDGTKRRWFCSYGCMREFEKKKTERKKYKTRDCWS